MGGYFYQGRVHGPATPQYISNIKEQPEIKQHKMSFTKVVTRLRRYLMSLGVRSIFVSGVSGAARMSQVSQRSEESQMSQRSEQCQMSQEVQFRRCIAPQSSQVSQRPHVPQRSQVSQRSETPLRHLRPWRHLRPLRLLRPVRSLRPLRPLRHNSGI